MKSVEWSVIDTKFSLLIIATCLSKVANKSLIKYTQPFIIYKKEQITLIITSITFNFYIVVPNWQMNDIFTKYRFALAFNLIHFRQKMLQWNTQADIDAVLLKCYFY